MIVYFDENIPPRIIKALQLLVKDNTIEIYSMLETYGMGCADESWIPQVGLHKGMVFTRDKRIQANDVQRKLYKQHGVSLIFISSDNKKRDLKYWEMVQLIIKHWSEVVEEFTKSGKPLSMICTPKKFEEL